MNLRQRAFLLSFLVLCAFSTGCANARFQTVEERMALYETQRQEIDAVVASQSLRSESVAIGLEKVGVRLDDMAPSNAQWLRFESLATIKWYLDDDIQNVYVQFQEWNPLNGRVRVMIITQDHAGEHAMRSGESVEHVWHKSTPPRFLVITCHQLLYREDGSVYGKFSFVEGPFHGL